MISTGLDQKRPCCAMLKRLSESLDVLEDPKKAADAFEMLSKHCVLMQLFGRGKVKWDLAKSDCSLAISPDDAQTVADELGKTRAVNGELEHYDHLLAFLNAIIANNAVLKQIQDKNPFFLQQLREGEKRFGRVPDTSLLKDENSVGNELSATEKLKTHPLLDKPQFDGINPKSNPNPKQNPEAEQQAEQLQNQYQYQLKPQPTMTPKMRPQGG